MTPLTCYATDCLCSVCPCTELRGACQWPGRLLLICLLPDCQRPIWYLWSQRYDPSWLRNGGKQPLSEVELQARLEQPDKILYNVPGRQKYGDPVLNISKRECRKRGPIFSMQKTFSLTSPQDHGRVSQHLKYYYVYLKSKQQSHTSNKSSGKATVGRKCGDLLCIWKRKELKLAQAKRLSISFGNKQFHFELFMSQCAFNFIKQDACSLSHCVRVCVGCHSKQRLVCRACAGLLGGYYLLIKTEQNWWWRWGLFWVCAPVSWAKGGPASSNHLSSAVFLCPSSSNGYDEAFKMWMAFLKLSRVLRL